MSAAVVSSPFGESLARAPHLDPVSEQGRVRAWATQRSQTHC